MVEQRKTKSLPWLYRYRSSPIFILLTICVAIFNDVFLFGTIIPILPYALPERIHVDRSNVQIYISVLLGSYGGAALIGSLLFGWIGDRIRRRHAIFLCGLGTLLSATLLLDLGRSIVLLIIGRFLQGLSAAVVWTSSLALLTDLLGPKRYGEAMGYANIAQSLGTTSAPLLGGLVYSKGGYSAVSLMNMLTVAAALVMGLVMVEPIKEKPDSRSNGPRSIHSSGNGDVKTVNHDYGHSNYGSSSSSHSGTETEVDSDSADEHTSLIPKQSRQERPRSTPAYHLLLKSPRILAAMGGFFTYAFVIVSLEGLTPLYVKTLFHWDSSRAALIFLSWIIPGFLGPLTGKASDWFGSKWIAVGGLLFTVPPLILMRLVVHDSTEHKVLLCALLALVGVGLVCIPSSCLADMSTAANELKEERPDDFGDCDTSNQSFGLFVFAYSCGSLVGPVITGVMKTNFDFGTATLILACVSIVTSIPIAFKIPAVSRRTQDSTQV